MQGTEPTWRVAWPSSAMPIRIRPARPLSDDELYELCRRNRELRIERTAEGEIIVMSPTGGGRPAGGTPH